MRKSTKSTDFCRRSQFFQLEATLMKTKSFISQFLAGVGVSLQILMLQRCAIANLE